MLEKLKSLFRRNEDRKKYSSEFLASMDAQLKGFLRIGALLSSVAWLEFALKTDALLHPEFPELRYFRFGLTAIGVTIFLASFLKPFGKIAADFLRSFWFFTS